MRHQLFESIIVNQQTIYWKAYSGLAVGVQKYTKTHVSGGDGSVSSWVETIIELSIQQDDGNETQMTLRGEEIRVRDGQRVSGIFGYTENKSSYWLIFVNHDAKKWYWVNTPRSFFESLRLFVFLSGWWVILFVAILAISALLLIYSPIYSFVHPYLIWATVGIITGIVGIMFCVAHLMVQSRRVHLSWKKIEPQLIEIALQLLK